MARFGKYTAMIYLLLAVAALEFVGLAGVLLLGGQEGAGPTALAADVEDPAAPAAEEEVMPAWLEPTPTVIVEKSPPPGELTAAEILSSAQVIAHGMGAAGGEATLNCREGFLEQYAKGVRVFEVDLRLTRDQKVVLRHDWRTGWQDGVGETAVPTLEEFLSKPIQKKYTPLSFQDLLLMMEEYPDICIITDSKFTEAEIVTLQFEAMLQDARDLGLSYLFDRMAIQIYDPLMFRVVDAVHHFRYYIYTLYTDGFARTEEDFQEKAAFCVENGILGITMWDYWWRAEYAPIAGQLGLAVYTHTVNDAAEAARLLDEGVKAVYTDELTPGDLAPAAENDIPQDTGEPKEEGESTWN